MRARRQRTIRRELLTGLVRKDLKVKYQGSALGFAWSLANPLLTLIVYSLMFSVVFKSGIPQFGFYLMCGLLIWNFFSGSVSAACGSVIGNSGLVKKVPFPLTVLPTSSVAFAAVHYVLQMLVLVVAMAAFGHAKHWDASVLLIVPALAVALIITMAISFLVAALNVRYRDTSHIVDVVLIAGMWLNPIVYSLTLSGLREKLISHHLWQLYLLNPITDVVLSMQRALYGDISIPGPTPGSTVSVLPSSGVLWYLKILGVGAVVSLVIFAFAYRLYRRMSSDFAEEL